MNKLIFIILFSISLFYCADSPRDNCREELYEITSRRDGLLISLLGISLDESNPRKDDILINTVLYSSLYEQALEKERACDNDLFYKLTSPNSKDFD